MSGQVVGKLRLVEAKGHAWGSPPALTLFPSPELASLASHCEAELRPAGRRVSQCSLTGSCVFFVLLTNESKPRWTLGKQ